LSEVQTISREQAEAAKVSFWGSFESAETEAAYRQHHRRQDTVQAYVAVGLGVLLSLAFSITDYRLLGPGTQFQMLLAARIGFASVSIVILALIRRGLRPVTTDRVLLGWMLLGAALTLTVASTRISVVFLAYAVSVVVIVFLIYVVVPVPMPVQVAVALSVTVADTLVLFSSGVPVSPVLRRTVIASYALANLIGAFSSWNLHQVKREQFAALQREGVLRAGLETAIAEIRTLEGIVPICAHCKNVRNDDGYWQQVEVYVRDHTHAEFSHGICPNCSQKLFGEYLKPGA